MTKLPRFSQKLLCSLTLAVTGLALNASAATLVLVDEFGAPIQGAQVTVTPMNNPDAALPGSSSAGSEGFVANELRTPGYYALPSIIGGVVVEVVHDAFGTMMAKASIAQGAGNIELVLGGNGDGMHAPGSDAVGSHSGRARSGGSQDAGGNEDVGSPNCATATIIPWTSITAAGGYNDCGTTGTTNTQPVTCGISGSDVFYTFTPAVNSAVRLTTCLAGSPADSVLQLRTGVCGASLACSDDSCSPIPPGGNPNGFNSTIASINVTAGQQYTVQVDNWASNASASYCLRVDLAPQVTCPAGGILENEPLCGINNPPLACGANDFTNGGCNFPAPQEFSPLSCGDTYCGTYGNCGSTRDTDWYQIVVPPGQLQVAKWCCTGEANSVVGLVNNGGGSGLCPATAFQAVVTPTAFNEGCVQQLLFPGTWWWFQATNSFAGVPCGADYNCSLACVSACCGGGGPAGSSN